MEQDIVCITIRGCVTLACHVLGFLCSLCGSCVRIFDEGFQTHAGFVHSLAYEYVFVQLTYVTSNGDCNGGRYGSNRPSTCASSLGPVIRVCVFERLVVVAVSVDVASVMVESVVASLRVRLEGAFVGLLE